MSDVRIERQDNLVTVSSPFNRDFVAGAKRLCGRWSKPCWVFPAAQEQRVRDLCREVYGTDGDDTVEMVAVQYRVTSGDVYGSSELVLCGQPLVKRWGRDQAVSLDCAVLDGDFAPSGGSAKYPRIGEIPESGVLIEFDAPRPKAEELVRDCPEHARIVSTPGERTDRTVYSRAFQPAPAAPEAEEPSQPSAPIGFQPTVEATAEDRVVLATLTEPDGSEVGVVASDVNDEMVQRVFSEPLAGLSMNEELWAVEAARALAYVERDRRNAVLARVRALLEGADPNL